MSVRWDSSNTAMVLSRPVLVGNQRKKTAKSSGGRDWLHGKEGSSAFVVRSPVTLGVE